VRLLFQFLEASIVLKVLAVGSKLGLILLDNFVLLDVSTRSLESGREVGLMRDLGYGRFASLIRIDKRLAGGLRPLLPAARWKPFR
jgi:hypothetical protein